LILNILPITPNTVLGNVIKKLGYKLCIRCVPHVAKILLDITQILNTVLLNVEVRHGEPIRYVDIVVWNLGQIRIGDFVPKSVLTNGNRGKTFGSVKFVASLLRGGARNIALTNVWVLPIISAIWGGITRIGEADRCQIMALIGMKFEEKYLGEIIGNVVYVGSQDILCLTT